VGYQGRPRARFGHRPDACFPAHGWEQTAERSLPVTVGDLTVPGILYEFRPRTTYGRTARVLATYLLNGRYVADPGDFQAYATRSAFNARPAYITRIQVTGSGAEEAEDLEALQEFMALVAPLVAERMPYWEP
jgi:hypothetical protein